MTEFHEETKKVIKHLKRRLLTLIDSAHTAEILKYVVSNYLERLLRLGPEYIENEELLQPTIIPHFKPPLRDNSPVFPFTARDPRNIPQNLQFDTQTSGIYGSTAAKDDDTLFHGIRIPAGSRVIQLPSIKAHVRDFFYVDGNVRHFVSIDDRTVDEQKHPADRVYFHSSCPNTDNEKIAEAAEQAGRSHRSRRNEMVPPSAEYRLPTSTSQPEPSVESDVTRFEREFRKKMASSAALPIKPMHPSCGAWACNRRNSCLYPDTCDQGPGPRRNRNWQIAEEERSECRASDRIREKLSALRCKVADNAATYEQYLRDRYEVGGVRVSAVDETADSSSSEFEKLLAAKYSSLENGCDERAECVSGGGRSTRAKDVSRVSTTGTGPETIDEKEKCEMEVLQILDERRRELGLDFRTDSKSADEPNRGGDKEVLDRILEVQSETSDEDMGKIIKTLDERRRALGIKIESDCERVAPEDESSCELGDETFIKEILRVSIPRRNGTPDKENSPKR